MQYKCIRDTYVDRYYYAGEIVEAEEKPNEHFISEEEEEKPAIKLKKNK